ncbi:cysteine--tRNA ligase [Klebsiella pneumoniae]|uniref:cysteine--tRNA ligase n=1 Tax=Klebsiella pneumoniae TaxID=573 RepID=UPI00200FFAAD|nr:cysteine--tRNA ligase [Klebsiella pneumoniae]MCL0838954.1 cysteine--tRNA ligase [Klebsiella pneumoniae]
MIKLTNTLGMQKELLVPVKESKIGMYVCGVTVYDLCHLGHARTFVAFDMIVRYLRFRGYDVTFVRNITDIDDKIIQRARDTGEDWRSLTERMVHEMHIDFAKLGILPPNIEPRPTEHIPQIISMIERLLHRQFAYIAENGDVMFSTASAKGYGKLSGQDITMLRAGTRIEVNEYKRDPLDFVLWKRAKPGEPVWPSPWGEGRPGWHIECSAMNCHYLGTHFDIHGGGSDLIFPHHENEIAQSTSANDGPYVNYWLHTGMVTVNKEKMSKSLNNFFTLRDILNRFDAQSVRFFLLSAHYRKPLNYSEENIHLARASLTRLYTACQFADGSRSEQHDAWRARFCEAMDDDFNTPQALAILFELTREINRLCGTNDDEAAALATTLKDLGNVLGLLEQSADAFLKNRSDLHTAELQLIEKLIHQRSEARRMGKWDKADRLRNELAEQGIDLEDVGENTSWRIR